MIREIEEAIFTAKYDQVRYVHIPIALADACAEELHRMKDLEK